MEQRLFKIKLPDGQESAPFDGNALVAYAQSGHINPGTWVFDVQQNRWAAAEQIDLLRMHFAMGGPPGYYPPQVSSRKPASSAAVIFIPAVIVIIIVGVFLVLLPIFRNSATAGPLQTISTTDGLYAVSIPGEWTKVPDPDTSMVNYHNSTDMDGVAIKSVNIGPTDPADLNRMFAAITKALTQKQTWAAVGPAATVTVGGFPAMSQSFTEQKGLLIYNNHSTLVIAPKQVYFIVQIVAGDDSEAQAEQTKILDSFHVTGK